MATCMYCLLEFGNKKNVFNASPFNLLSMVINHGVLMLVSLYTNW